MFVFGGGGSTVGSRLSGHALNENESIRLLHKSCECIFCIVAHRSLHSLACVRGLHVVEHVA